MKRAVLGSVLVLVLVVGCQTTSPTLEPARQILEAKQSTLTVKEGFFSGDEYIKTGTEMEMFDGFYADAQRVDELTFYHVAGDTERRDAVIEHRTQSNNVIIASWGSYGAAAGGVAAGAGMFAVLGAKDPEAFAATTPGQVTLGLIIAGGLLAGFGAFGADALLGPSKRLHYAGNGTDVAEHLLFPLSDADAAAERHNAKVRGGSAPTEGTPTEGTPAEGAPGAPEAPGG